METPVAEIVARRVAAFGDFPFACAKAISLQHFPLASNQYREKSRRVEPPNGGVGGHAYTMPTGSMLPKNTV